MEVERKASIRRQDKGNDGLEGHEFSSGGKFMCECVTKPSQAGVYYIMYS